MSWTLILRCLKERVNVLSCIRIHFLFLNFVTYHENGESVSISFCSHRRSTVLAYPRLAGSGRCRATIGSGMPRPVAATGRPLPSKIASLPASVPPPSTTPNLARRSHHQRYQRPSDQRPRALGSGCPLRSTFVCCTDRDTASIKKSPGSSLRLPFCSPERHGWVYSLSPPSLSPHFLEIFSDVSL